MPLDIDRVNQILKALQAMLQRRAIAHRLDELRRFTAEPEQVDEIVLAAIAASLALNEESPAGSAPGLP